MNNSWTAALTAIMLLGLVVFMAPNILALNRGKVLRNIAIWLAIFAGLGLAYQFFGPGGSAKLPFSFGAAQQQEEKAPAPAKNNDGEKGFTPPAE